MFYITDIMYYRYYILQILYIRYIIYYRYYILQILYITDIIYYRCVLKILLIFQILSLCSIVCLSYIIIIMHPLEFGNIVKYV